LFACPSAFVSMTLWFIAPSVSSGIGFATLIATTLRACG
jgi:hypothetical protein